LTAPSRDGRFTVPESGKSAATLSGYEQERKDQGRAGSGGVLPRSSRCAWSAPGPSAGWWCRAAREALAGGQGVLAENGFLIKTELPEAA